MQELLRIARQETLHDGTSPGCSSGATDVCAGLRSKRIQPRSVLLFHRQDGASGSEVLAARPIDVASYSGVASDRDDCYGADPINADARVPNGLAPPHVGGSASHSRSRSKASELLLVEHGQDVERANGSAGVTDFLAFDTLSPDSESMAQVLLTRFTDRVRPQSLERLGPEAA